MQNFINRKDTLGFMETLWNKKTAQFLVVYGRRRVGKTAVLGRFSSKKPILHWMAYRTTGKELLSDFSRHVYTILHNGEAPEGDFTYGSWKVALETISSSPAKLGIVIDEFPYIAEADPSFPSVLQAVWDKSLSKTNNFLAVSGSSISMVKNEILKEKGPLYGRATAILHLAPIKPANLDEFFPRYSSVQLVEVYGITGGVPKYFEFISDNMPVLKNIEIAIKTKSTFLTSEPEFLLSEEFRETRTYLAILRALGKGASEIREISGLCGIDTKALSKYVDQLMELKLVERKISADKEPDKGRKGRYAICDPFINFYFHFISPYLQEIEKDRYDAVIKNIERNFDSYIGKYIFEDICREWLAGLADKGKLSFLPERVGSYWDRDMQIDVMGINHHDRAMILGEAKWTNQKVGLEILNNLEEKTKKLSKQSNYHCQLVLFSRSGFTGKLIKTAEKKKVLLASIKEII